LAQAGIARYRLLDTTRAFALKKLGESGECERLARRHAEFYRDLFERVESESETRPAAEWLAEYGSQIDNLRAALDWAFSSGGDMSIGVALTTAAVPLWMHLSLMEECRGCVERALATLGVGANRDARREMKLHAALAASLMYTRGAVSEIGAGWTKPLEIAESLDDVEYRLWSLRRLGSFLGEMAEAFGRAGQIAEGLAAIEEALAWTERTDERWRTAGLLHWKGELLLLQGAPGAAATAEDHLRQVLDWARQQGVLYWELRAATSLARLLRDQGRPADAVALL
jgi:predicted ATPase